MLKKAKLYIALFTAI